MDLSAIIMMIGGIAVIWGGLTLSVIHAWKKSREKK